MKRILSLLLLLNSIHFSYAQDFSAQKITDTVAVRKSLDKATDAIREAFAKKM
jgi:hypothetical protein